MARKTADYDLLVKILLLGDKDVGKGSLLLRFSEDAFTSSFITTIGIDFKIKNVEIEGKRIKLQIWDTAGDTKFRTITQSYYRGAMGAMLVYDITDEVSFQNIHTWLQSLEQHAPENINKVLIGNNCHRESERQVETSRARRLAEEFNMELFETSAKDDTNVAEAFMHIATQVKRRLIDGDTDKFLDDEAHAQHLDVDFEEMDEVEASGKDKGRCF